MAAIFGPQANLGTRAAIAGMAVAVLAAIAFWIAWPRTDYARSVGFTPPQPVPFSHQHHVAGLGIDCRFCHTSVEVSARAGLPPTHTCMGCHSQIWTGADVLAPVRRSLADNVPLAWARVTDLPDYVYFNHSIHVAKGVGCQSCHGDVAAMPLTTKARSLTMGFCLDCHRNPGPQLRPASEIWNTNWRRDASTPSPEALVAQHRIGSRNLTECSICHR